jgi:hypothetical protein
MRFTHFEHLFNFFQISFIKVFFLPLPFLFPKIAEIGWTPFGILLSENDGE